jgi:hypothetical protein
MRNKLSPKSRRFLTQQALKPTREQVRKARELKAALLLELKIERKTQARIFQELIEAHGGDIPVSLIYNHLADRRQAATTTSCGAGLARS